MNKDDNITLPNIKMNIWQNITDKNIVMILYDGQTPFPSSDTAMSEWRIFYTFTAYNPLIPPYPKGTQLFRARHSTRYPYGLLNIVPVLDIFKIRDPGTYFVAYTSPYDGTTKLPFEDMLIYVEDAVRLTPPPPIGKYSIWS